MTAPPDWTRPPRPEGWFAEDLDRLPEAPRHTELIDGLTDFSRIAKVTFEGRKPSASPLPGRAVATL